MYKILCFLQEESVKKTKEKQSFIKDYISYFLNKHFI
jgi:hypothetical protein